MLQKVQLNRIESMDNSEIDIPQQFLHSPSLIIWSISTLCDRDYLLHSVSIQVNIVGPDSSIQDQLVVNHVHVQHGKLSCFAQPPSSGVFTKLFILFHQFHQWGFEIPSMISLGFWEKLSRISETSPGSFPSQYESFLKCSICSSERAVYSSVCILSQRLQCLPFRNPFRLPVPSISLFRRT